MKPASGFCIVFTGLFLTAIVILGLNYASNSLTVVSLLINKMHCFALFCTEMHCFESPLIEFVYALPIFDLSMRTIRVKRIQINLG
jgi:hypothetical protein